MHKILTVTEQRHNLAMVAPIRKNQMHHHAIYQVRSITIFALSLYSNVFIHYEHLLISG